jgi:LacI family transcriptional regulator
VAKSNTPRIAVLVDTATGWGRRLIRGIVGCAHKHGPWNLWVHARGQDEPLRLPPGWRGEGIIARISDHDTAHHVAAAHVPVVNVSGIELRGVGYCRVTTDLGATGRLAAEHLLGLGLKNFAYGALPRLFYVRRQYRGFAETLRQAGYPSPGYYQPSFQSDTHKGWAAQERELAQWLKRLPKPVGIFTWATTLGCRLIEIAPRLGLHVPEDVAILGGDYDELLCETCIPSLSGIAVPSQQVGYEAALFLDRLMRGEAAPPGPILIEPQGVVSRHSTDILAIQDEDLAKAIRFIRDHATDPIGVQDVLQKVAISRRRLERGFRSVLGHSPSAEIRRRHIERARQLLTETDMPIPDVADASGFGSPTYFAYIFKREIGQSPLKYRTATRAR